MSKPRIDAVKAGDRVVVDGSAYFFGESSVETFNSFLLVWRSGKEPIDTPISIRWGKDMYYTTLSCSQIYEALTGEKPK